MNAPHIPVNAGPDGSESDRTGSGQPDEQRRVVNILMVDDRQENLIALEATLHELAQNLSNENPPIHLNLVRAMSGPEALRKLLNQEFAVILLDVQMPGMDGYETAALIRQRARSQRTPIIFLTAINTSEMNVFKGYSLGAVDYLFKPYEPEVLRAKVNVFIDLYRKAQEIQRMADEARAQAELLRTSNDELAKSNKVMGGLYRELERKSDELSRQRDFTDKILETAGSYLVIFNAKGELERFNVASERLSGYKLDEVKGRKAWEVLVAPEAAEGVRDAFEKAIHGEPGVCIDMLIKPRQGETRFVNMSFTPLMDESGKPAYVIASGVDITERHQAEEKIRKMNEELEERVLDRTQKLRESNTELEREVVERRKAEIALKQAKESAELANAAKDQFLAVLSHELRTPLTPVLAIVQMLDEDPALLDEHRTWVQTIGRNVQLEARLIDDLLDLTRISNGKLQLKQENVDTDRLIHDTVEICKEDIAAKALKLELKLQAKATVVQGDIARLHQVLWNLLKNAVKFTPPEGHITIVTENASQDVWRCCVIDSGIGIPPDHLDRVFNAFDQGDKTITRRFGGLGLGLAISKALVEQHGGSIAAESAGTNRGAKFTIELPLKQVEPPAQKPRAAGKNGSAPKSGENSQAGDKNAQGSATNGAGTLHSVGRILLVEDNADTSQALQVLLERKGFTVIAAHSVSSAVEIAKTYHCDLVISDIGLPDGTGIDMLRKLNLIRPTRGIAMSGFGMEEDIQRSLAAGFQAHLVKPVNFDQLNEALQHLLVTSHL